MSDLPNFDQAIAALTTAEGSPFEITEGVVDGQTMKVWKNLPSSLREVFATTRLHGDKTFLVYEDETWSFAQTMARVDEIADLLVDRYGVGKGDRVAIAMRNYPEWIFSFAAITSVGGIAVCMNAWWKEDEMAYGLEDSGCKVLLADIERATTAAPNLARFGVQAVVVRQSPIGLLLGLADLTVYVAGGSPTRLPDLTLRDARALCHELSARAARAAAADW